MLNLSLLTLNVRGLIKPSKRKTIFNLCKSYDIICLQECHIEQHFFDQWRDEWGGGFYFSVGSNRSKGQIILLNKNLCTDSIEIIARAQRALGLQIKMEGYIFNILNIYGASEQKERINFLNELNRILQTIDNEPLIVCGDFNMYLENGLDNIAGDNHSNKDITAFNSWVERHDLIDSWRHCNPSVKDFTWSRGPKPFIARRLDFIFVSTILKETISKIKHEPFYGTDHKGVIINFKFEHFKRGPSYWKMNDNLLEDKKYVDMMNEFLTTEIENIDWNNELWWDIIKANIKNITIEFGIKKSAMSKSRIKKLNEKLKYLNDSLTNGDLKTEVAKEYFKIKQELDIIQTSITRGAIIRAKQKWMEEGEKNSKLFLGLEKSRGNNDTITKLKIDNNKTLNKPIEILSHIKSYYQKLYTSNKKLTNIPEKLEAFMKGEKFTKLEEAIKRAIDKKLEIKELDDAIQCINKESSPGSDGLTTHFYLKFWDKLRHLLLKSFLSALDSGQLTITQRRGILKLSQKCMESDKNDLNNYRPITLTNTDYKIFSKVLGNRIIKAIDLLINHNQTGFIKGRSISDHIRTVDDILLLTRKYEVEGIMTNLDYKKAFDSVEKETIIKSLELFNFGPYFINMVKTLISNSESSVQNGGWISTWFKTERGIRQGCCVSPLLFVLVVELLAIKIRNDTSIKPITIPNSKGGQTELPKILSYADDMDYFIKDSISLTKALGLTDQFSECSGLELNRKKSLNAWIGSNRHKTEEIGNIPTLKPGENMKVLGVFFSPCKEASNIEENWTTKIEKTEKIINQWQKHNLTIQGKVTVVKTFILSIWTHTMQSIIFPDEIIKLIDLTIFKFLWQKKSSIRKASERIKRSVLCLPPSKGGLNMISFQDQQVIFQFKWLKKYMFSKSKYTIAEEYFSNLGGIEYFMNTRPALKTININNIKSSFWCKAAYNWHDFKRKDDILNRISWRTETLFHNELFLYKGTTIFSKKWIQKGLSKVENVLVNGDFISINEVKRITGNYVSLYLDYFKIRNCFTPKILKSIKDEAVETESHQLLVSNTLKSSNSDLRIRIINQRDTFMSGASFWKRKYNSQIERKFLVANKATKEIKLRVLHYKLIHNIYPTNIVLNRMKIKSSELCDFCGVADYIEHFFINCKLLRGFWKIVENAIRKYTNISNINLTEENILLGVDDSDMKTSKDNLGIINYIILIAKMSISKFKCSLVETHLGLQMLFESELNFREKYLNISG